MDTSPEYINMCRKATELQEMWKPETGDFYKLPGHFITCIVLKNSLIDMDAIWLPRVDQLIEMLAVDFRPTEGFTMVISDRSKTEQELLSEYYKRAFHMCWNGDDWIKL